MNTALATTNNRCFGSNSAWNSPSVYSNHGNVDQQQQYHNHHQYLDRRLTYDDGPRYSTVADRQYVVSYPSTAADMQGPCFNSAHQADNMAATGSCYLSTGSGNAFSVDTRQIQRLPDVVGGHLQGWTNQRLSTTQDSSNYQQGTLVHIISELFRLR